MFFSSSTPLHCSNVCHSARWNSCQTDWIVRPPSRPIPSVNRRRIPSSKMRTVYVCFWNWRWTAMFRRACSLSDEQCICALISCTATAYTGCAQYDEHRRGSTLNWREAQTVAINIPSRPRDHRTCNGPDPHSSKPSTRVDGWINY